MKIAPRKLPIGIQDFKKLRKNDFVYVDKTKLMWDLACESKPYFLSRPRRFGKSLLISTMEYYFLGERDLFDGLAIQALEDEKENAWVNYPVFHFDLNAEKYDSEEKLDNFLDKSLKELEKKYGCDPVEKTPATRFAGIIKRAYEKTGQGVVVLIDEYDKPLISTQNIRSELNDQYRETLKGFYGVLKSCDKYLRFVFLTGVSRFSKVSIFSDLNQLINISMTDKYSDICGITEKELLKYFQPELQAFQEKNKLNQGTAIKELKRYYDGYKFSEEGNRLFNPFSLLNSLNEKKLENYWFETGTPTLLINLIKSGDFEIRELDDTEPINKSALKDSEPTFYNLVPLFFQTGYLTLKEYDEEFKEFTLTYPNEEVRYAFLNHLMPLYLREVGGGAFSVSQFVKDVRRGEVEEFMKRVCAMISSMAYSATNPTGEQLREVDFHRMFYLIFSLMGQFVQCEVASLQGRADAIIEVADAIYIFEFKLFNNATPQQALEQIRQKGYAEPYRAKGKPIIGVGIAFNENEKPVGKWEIDNL